MPIRKSRLSTKIASTSTRVVNFMPYVPTKNGSTNATTRSMASSAMTTGPGRASTSGPPEQAARPDDQNGHHQGVDQYARKLREKDLSERVRETDQQRA